MAARKPRAKPGRGAGRAGRGRKWGWGIPFALALAGFLAVAMGVIWRRSYGTERSRDIQELEQRRVQLEARRTQLESEIRELASRTRLAPIVERRLQMHVPSDSQVVILPRPPQERNR
jgi:cell division protein FtsL